MKRFFVAVAVGCCALVVSVCRADGPPAAQSTPAAVQQYRDAVSFQNQAVYDLATDEWTKFLTNFPKDPLAGKAQHYLGICLLQQKKLDESVAAFTKALSDFPASDITEQTYLNLGLAQYSQAQQGKAEAFDAAAATFAKLVEKYPEGPHKAQALFYQGESLYARGKKPEAVAAYSAFVAAAPADSPLRADALYALGVAQEELQKWPEAGATYDVFLKDYASNPLKAEVVMRRAETLFNQNQFADAEKWFATSATAADFKLADYAMLRQAASLYAQKKYPEAAVVYATLPSKYPQSASRPSATLSAGNCYYLAGNSVEAQKWLAAAVALGGDGMAEASHWLAKSYLKDKKPADALAVVEKALPAAAKSPFANNLLLDKADAIYELPDRRKEATAIYAAVATADAKGPLAPQAMYMAAFSALGQAQYQPALDYANQFLAAYSADALAADVLYVAGEANLQLAKYPEATALYKQLVEKFPQHADVELWKVRLGLIPFVEKKYADVVATLAPALATLKTPDLVAEANYLIGAAQLEQQQYEPAAKSLTAALFANGKWRQADETLLALSAAYRQLNKLPEAKDAAAKVLNEFPQSKQLDRAYYRLGEIAYLQNDYATAIAQYSKVLEGYGSGPLAGSAWYSLGWAQMGAANYVAAVTSFTNVIDKFPQNPLVGKARYARAVARQQTKEFSGAVEDVVAYLATNPSPTEKADAQYVQGLCEVGQQKFAAAIAVFKALLEANPKYAGLDKVLYELAWAQKSEKQDADAVATFARLATEKSDSPLAAESLYHVGESQYTAKDYAKAADNYFNSMTKAVKLAGANAAKSDVAEKSAHKLAWAYYQQNQFDKAQQSFEYQATSFTGGELAADGLFMAGESAFKQNKFDVAYAAYQKSLAKRPTNKDFQTLLLLHAGQAAATQKKWDESLKLLDEGIKAFADSSLLAEYQYERGWALQNLGKSDDAFKQYEVVSAGQKEVSARARFMMGEIQFEKKEYKEAVRQFFKVAYGFGYPQSPDAFKKWQAKSAYEAGRAFEVLKMGDQAKKSYTEVVEKYPQSDVFKSAQERLAAIK